MYKNYVKIAWRNLKKNSLYTLINIAGLTIGMVSVLLIGVYIKHELSYDQFHQNAENIVRVTMDYNFGDAPQTIAVTGTKVGPQFKRTFPGVIDFVRLYKKAAVISSNGKMFDEKNVLYADPSFFKIFSFKLISANPDNVLNAPDRIVVTQMEAKKYFGETDAMGKTIKVGSKDFVISGIAADAPENSQIKFDFILPFSLVQGTSPENWWEANYFTYLLLKDKDQVLSLPKQIAGYMSEVSHRELKMDGGHYLTYHLEPLLRVHLYSGLPDGLEPNGNILYVYILIVVALLIVIIAIVNYINLSVAQSAGRGGEIGLRKVLGAAKGQLFKQFVGESFLVVVIAVILAFWLAVILLPLFNQISGKQLQASVLFDPVILASLVPLTIIIGFAAGAYPALLLSNVKLIKILKSGFSFSSGKGVRSSLIVFQFVISIFLIITTVIIVQQLSYIRNKDIGYNKSNVVVLPVSLKMLPQLDFLKKAISNLPGVDGVTAANNEPIDVKWSDGVKTNYGKGITVNALPADEDFVKTMQLKIVAGRDFSQSDVAQMDSTNNFKNFHYAFMLNESAARALGWSPQQAIDKEISKGTTGKVVAVVKDFHFKSLHDPIGPLVIFLDHYQNHSLMVRVSSRNTAATLLGIEKVWKERITYRPFEYKFLDDDYNALYHNEQRASNFLTIFSVVAICLAGLGLFAVTAFVIVQRTKEIGLRKVLGADTSAIIVLITRKFALLVIIAAMVASPIAWYASNKWLQNFSYHINLSWWVWLLASGICLTIAMITVGLQSLRAASANPIKSLRNE